MFRDSFRFIFSAKRLPLYLTFFGLLTFISCLYFILPKITTYIYANLTRGFPNDFVADVVLGQPDFSEGTINEKVAFKGFNPGGTFIDRNKHPNTLYVSDNANSRILGYSSLGKCQNNGKSCFSDTDCSSSTCKLTVNKSADIVIGQPDFNHSACNGDSSGQNYPAFPSPSASSLCGMPTVQISPSEGGAFVSFTVDSKSRLFFPDWLNNRVLMYKDPFTNDKTADAVFGQSNFSSYQCNRGLTKPNATTLCFGTNTSYNPAFAIGVDVDTNGNLWVADTLNNRILRFPYDSTKGRPSDTANLVLGQTNFGNNANSSALNGLYQPSAVRVDKSGNVYVADSSNNRILLYAYPQHSGMTGVAWASGFNYPTGIEFDPAGGIWINDTGNDMIELWNSSGTSVQKLLYRDQYNNPSSSPLCSSSVGVCSQGDSRGSIGIDSKGDLFVASSSDNQDVVRFPAPIPTPQANILVPADYRLFYPPGGLNYLTGRSLTGPMGIAFADNQLFVADSWRVLFWNNPGSVTNWKKADGVVGAPDFNSTSGDNYGRLRADNANHLYVVHKYNIEIYNLPLTSGATPVSVITPVLKDLEGNTVDLSINGDLVVGGLSPTPDGKYLWVASNFSQRAVRIRNPLTNPVVDIVLGQADSFGTLCNRGGDAALDTLCDPGDVTLDKNNNIFVNDNSLEVAGNGRLLEYDASNFPLNNTSTIYGTPANRVIINNRHTFEPAFDSQNRMVIGYNSYSYSNTTHSLDYFNNIYTSSSPSGSFSDFYAMPYAMTFDSSGNLYVSDINRWHILIYKQPFANSASPAPTSTPNLQRK